MDRLAVIVDPLNDIFQIMLLHNEYMIPIIAMSCDNYVDFMEMCRKIYMKYEDMTLQNSPVIKEFINTLESVDKV